MPEENIVWKCARCDIHYLPSKRQVDKDIHLCKKCKFKYLLSPNEKIEKVKHDYTGALAIIARLQKEAGI